jgi:hypothetical protein
MQQNGAANLWGNQMKEHQSVIYRYQVNIVALWPDQPQYIVQWRTELCVDDKPPVLGQWQSKAHNDLSKANAHYKALERYIAYSKSDTIWSQANRRNISACYIVH